MRHADVGLKQEMSTDTIRPSTNNANFPHLLYKIEAKQTLPNSQYEVSITRKEMQVVTLPEGKPARRSLS